MFKNIIVGVDRSGGRDQIALAKRLLANGGQLALAHVFPGTPQVWQPTPEFDSPERREVAEMLERAARETGVDAAIRWREGDSTGRGLHELCEIAEADLLVVGSSRRGLLGRVLLHDDTHAALNAAPCAVAVAPIEYASQPVVMREIGVAYNGSPESRHAVDVARELARQSGARLSAFEAVPRVPYSVVSGPAAELPDRMVKDALEQIAALGGIEAHAAYGNPVEELAVYSASLDLLVVGSRGYGPLGRLIHGSTSQHLARVARCPLLVLTRTMPTDANGYLATDEEHSVRDTDRVTDGVSS
jgi:nucleotide-binding universal stress UspA family protein